MSRPASGAVIHRNVALIACDTAATLQETVRKLGDLSVYAVPIGDRHLILPASRAAEVLDGLREHGQYPRLVGEVAPSDVPTPETPETEEAPTT